MQKLLTAEQTRLADQYTIANKPIASIELMEAASKAFTAVFTKRFPDRDLSIAIYCGTGSNGGDGLAVARLLKGEGYQHISVKIARFSDKSTPDFLANHIRLAETGISVTELKPGEDFPLEDADILIDALIGSGLNKALQGDLQRLVEYLNKLSRTVVAIDVPSGFLSEGRINTEDPAVKADLVISFQRPKLNFLLPESSSFVRQYEFVDIGLDEEYIQSLNSPYALLAEEDIKAILKPRAPFSHKGTYGHALIIAGTEETMGAALLAADSSLYTGAGLTTACIPSGGLTALNSTYPEVMSLLRDKTKPSEINWEKYQAIAIGPGLGTNQPGKDIFETTLRRAKKPLVIDADAINLLAEHYELIGLVPAGSVFTPHMKEFDRLFGPHTSWWDRLQTGMEYSKQLGCVILLKNRYSIIFTTKGECVFNSTGCPAMATGGMGDVLTGVIASFLAQGYSCDEAAVLAAYVHGISGEKLVEEKGYAVVPAGMVLKRLPEVIGSLQGDRS